MAQVIRRYRADRSRLYLTGISMGGMGLWLLAKETPGFFAAPVPVAGWNDPEWAPDLAHTPIWVFHGAKDDIVPLAASEKMVQAMRDAGGDPVHGFTGYGPWDWTDSMGAEGLVRMDAPVSRCGESPSVKISPTENQLSFSSRFQ